MLLALALYASTAHAGIVANENTPHYDSSSCTTTGRRIGRTNASSFGSLRLPAAARTRLRGEVARARFGPNLDQHGIPLRLAANFRPVHGWIAPWMLDGIRPNETDHAALLERRGAEAN